MKRITKKGWILFLSISFLLPAIVYGTFYWYSNRVADLPIYGENYQVETRPPYFTVPPFSFFDQDSVLTDEGFVKDKVWVVHYFYTSCPVICPKMMKGMQEVQKAFEGNDAVRLVSLTVDPEHDHPAVLKRYAQTRKVGGKRWALLTGDKKELYRYARKGLFIVATDGDGGADDFIHSEKLVLVDVDGHIRGYYDGTEAVDINLLINDIRRLAAR